MSKHTGPLSGLILAIALIILWNIRFNRPDFAPDVRMVICLMPVGAIMAGVLVALVLRLATASRNPVRKPAAFSAVNVDDSNRDDPDESADDSTDDSHNGQTVFQMAWSRERGR